MPAGVPQGSIWGPLLFLICIDDLSGDLSYQAKLLAGDTSLFSVIHYITNSKNELNNDLKNVSDWAFQWKMTQANRLKKSFLVENEEHIMLFLGL